VQIYNLWLDTLTPTVLQTDNGSEFGAALQALCDLFNVKLIHSSVGHPQSQGATERTNQTFKDVVSGQLILAPTVNWSFQVGLAARGCVEARLGGVGRREGGGGWGCTSAVVWQRLGAAPLVHVRRKALRFKLGILLS